MLFLLSYHFGDQFTSLVKKIFQRRLCVEGKGRGVESFYFFNFSMPIRFRLGKLKLFLLHQIRSSSQLFFCSFWLNATSIREIFQNRNKKKRVISDSSLLLLLLFPTKDFLIRTRSLFFFFFFLLKFPPFLIINLSRYGN